jgi:hypothetical protein
MLTSSRLDIVSNCMRIIPCPEVTAVDAEYAPIILRTESSLCITSRGEKTSCNRCALHMWHYGAIHCHKALQRTSAQTVSVVEQFVQASIQLSLQSWNYDIFIGCVCTVYGQHILARAKGVNILFHTHNLLQPSHHISFQMMSIRVTQCTLPHSDTNSTITDRGLKACRSTICIVCIFHGQ